jgi:nuclear transport factor 2 (NTF2) superfamily protein
MDFWDTERSRLTLRFSLIWKQISENYHCSNGLELRNFNSSGILRVIAGMDAWKDADLPIANGEEPGTAELLVQERLVRIS